ncbi:transcription factor TGA1 [Corchorus olitorius]|uniref:Transcription factor TGA1 n=1 Tax=Corchorus olitorius TaxID=93759 RepID=A0A1R3HEC8_9ROSI|nr:transcription factor TGA1 [Corchorus olitorius]
MIVLGFLAFYDFLEEEDKRNPSCRMKDESTMEVEKAFEREGDEEYRENLKRVLVTQLDPLTEEQFLEVCNLKQSCQQAEDALSQGMEKLQENVSVAVAGQLGDGNSAADVSNPNNLPSSSRVTCFRRILPTSSSSEYAMGYMSSLACLAFQYKILHHDMVDDQWKNCIPAYEVALLVNVVVNMISIDLCCQHFSSSFEK